MRRTFCDLQHMKKSFTIVIFNPHGKHKIFRLIKMLPTGRSESLNPADLKAINKAFLAGDLSSKEAKKQIEALRKSIYRDYGIANEEPIFNNENLKDLERYWKSEYVPRLVRLVDKKTARWDIERSVTVLGRISLRAGSRQELQAAVDKAVTGNKHRRVVARVNALLKFLGRNFKLIAARKVRPEVRHLTFGEVQKLYASIPDRSICIMHATAFRTGCRIGELFALKPQHFNKKTSTLKVLTQIDRNGKERETKNRQRRTAYVLPDSEETLAEWFKVRDKVTMAQRLGVSKITQKYSRRLFPNEPLKWITFHDLRHSYAIHLLGMGVPYNLVAQSIGDSIAVAEEYYIGFDLSATSIDMINKMVKPVKD